MNNTSIFYDVKNDITNYEDAILFLIIGGRGTGKTYSALKYMYENKKKFIFMKRTNGDVKLMCQSLNQKEQKFSIDISPFKAINRDIGCNVRAYRLYDGFGGFWNCDSENHPVGDPIGYILSFNAISKFKGFDLSDCSYIIFDEFVPQPFERVNKHEGLQLMDLYRTVGRANFTLHNEKLRMLCLANATDVSCPVINDLELADQIVDMQRKGDNYMYLDDRAILVHRLENINHFREIESQNPIYKTMAGTKWAKMSLENEFSYNDFSDVGYVSIKYMTCICSVRENEHTYYIYLGDRGFYMTYKKSNKCVYKYDINKESDQRKFYIEQVIDICAEWIDGRAIFETFHMFDLITHYKSFYNVN